MSTANAADLDGLRAQFHTFSTQHCGATPLYRAITAAVSASPRVLELVARVPKEQRTPNLLLAAVHDRLLHDPSLLLAKFYPSVSGEGAVHDVEAAARAFVAFVIENEAALERVLLERSTQTNEVGRAAVILPSFARLKSEGIARVTLADLGTSAGLNLFADHYAVRYSNGLEVGRADSKVRVSSELRGSRVPSFADGLPEIVERRGIDQAPLDIAREADRRWLLACLWPDQLERFERIRAAIEIARSGSARIEQGKLPDDLDAFLAGARPDAHLTLLTTWVLAYLSDADRAGVNAAVDALGKRRDLSWILAEVPHKLPLSTSGYTEHDTVLALVRYRAGVRSETPLGRVHGHGTFVEWHAS